MSDLVVGTVLFDVSETIDQRRIRAYAEASKDNNPIHVDEKVAVAVGLAGPVAHGMLTVGIGIGHVMRWLDGKPHRFLRYETRFVKPVVVFDDVPAELSVSGVVGAVSDDEIRIDLRMRLAESGQMVLRPFRVFVG
ncbi:MaoC family dehydratase [Williamsia sp.]|uniref:MaoC family dehydratase n=1 Tax=Williamsia sp. TaxID=1872085 RepID=UPI002F954AE6